MEQSFLAYLRGRCRHLPQVAVGIGDDAAVLDPIAGQSVVCTDQIIDGVDFDVQQHALRDVGFKAMSVNLSDLAAMGAVPHSALVTLALPRENATRIAGDVYEGILEAAAEFQIAIAGGDLSTYEGPLAISVTLIGHVPAGQAWLRSGAVEGDAIVVTGSVGGSILGRHLRPAARIEMAQWLRKQVTVHAAIDISDGLSLDLDRLCAASGAGAELRLETLPIHDDAIILAEQTGRTPLEHAWSDGEDFELILTMSQADADRVCQGSETQLGGLDKTAAASPACSDLPGMLTQIGTIVGRTGLWKKTAGKVHRLSPQGYQHQGYQDQGPTGPPKG